MSFDAVLRGEHQIEGQKLTQSTRFAQETHADRRETEVSTKKKKVREKSEL